MSLGRLWPSWGCARPLICLADKGGLIGREQRSNYAEYTARPRLNKYISKYISKNFMLSASAPVVFPDVDSTLECGEFVEFSLV